MRALSQIGKLFALGAVALLASACASDQRKSVPPSNSGASDIPWSLPLPGEGAGPLGPAFDRR